MTEEVLKVSDEQLRELCEAIGKLEPLDPEQVMRMVVEKLESIEDPRERKEALEALNRSRTIPIKFRV